MVEVDVLTEGVLGGEEEIVGPTLTALSTGGFFTHNIELSGEVLVGGTYTKLL